MKRRIIYILILIFVLLSGGNKFVSAENEQRRIRFQVTTVEESPNGRRMLAQTTVEGVPGTDFNINLKTGNFKMQASFLTDLITEDKLKFRAKLDTRRLYGTSSANLPLYEEDNQKHILEVGFDESIVLLPFGRGDGAETLKIEITPTLFAVSKTDEEAQELKINFDKPIPSGEISIEAAKIPHRFAAEIILLADGREVAKADADCLLEEEKEIVLQPIEKSDVLDESFAVKLVVDKFNRSRPKDFVGINFDIYRFASQAGENQQLISRGAGITTLDSNLSYALEQIQTQNDGKKYELKFKVRLSAKESGS